MNTTTHTKGSGRRRFGLVNAALVSALAAVGGTLVIAATPAFATPIFAYTPMQPYIASDSGLMVGAAAGDFSYTSTGAPMARNVFVQADSVAPSSAVTFSWRDATAGGLWQQGPTSTSYALGPGYSAGATITDIPSSACGHTLQVEATGQTGETDGSGTPSYSPLYSFTTPPDSIVENCGPAVWLTSTGSYYTGIAGDGFTPGGQVDVKGTGPNLSSLRCVSSIRGLHCTVAPWIESVTATRTSFRLSCSLRYGCHSFVAQGGSEISATFPTPIAVCGAGPDYITAIDLSTSVSTSVTLQPGYCGPLR